MYLASRIESKLCLMNRTVRPLLSGNVVHLPEKLLLNLEFLINYGKDLVTAQTGLENLHFMFAQIQ